MKMHKNLKVAAKVITNEKHQKKGSGYPHDMIYNLYFCNIMKMS